MIRGGTVSAAGFTLIELLVSLALLAIMAATMSLAIGQLRPMQVFQQRLRETEVADAIVNVIARDLQSALSLPLMEGGSTSSTLVRGGPKGLVFSAIVPTGFRRSGLREVAYDITMGNKGESAIRSLRLRRFSNEDAIEKYEIDLGRFSLRFSYLIITETGIRSWSDHFNEINASPKAVRVEMQSQAPQDQHTVRVIVLQQGGQ